MARSRSAAAIEAIANNVIKGKGRTLTEIMLEVRRRKGQKKYNLPRLMKLKENVDDVISRDMQLFYMNVENESDKLVIYLHGGAYIDDFLPFHWAMLEKIASKTNATFILPDYPLAPFSDFRECYDKMTVFYKKILEYYPDKDIIFMGDSAGGGLALGLTMYFNELGLRLPDRHIVLSPWVDLIMDNPEIKEYLDVDPFLKLEDLKVDAEYWANGTDLKDYRLSPLYGDVSMFKDVALFTGTHEFFYPDIIRFSHKLDEANINNRVLVGEGLNHVYPIIPSPEGEIAINIIGDLIENNNVTV